MNSSAARPAILAMALLVAMALLIAWGEAAPCGAQTPSPKVAQAAPGLPPSSGLQPVGSLPADPPSSVSPAIARFLKDGGGGRLPATVSSLSLSISTPRSLPLPGAVAPTATANPPGNRLLPALPPVSPPQQARSSPEFPECEACADPSTLARPCRCRFLAWRISRIPTRQLADLTG